jgi:hypothetical protein
MNMLFVGEKRSELAKKRDVRWEDGALAAKQLFDALETCGIDPQTCQFANWFEDGKRTFIRQYDGIVIGMGQVVQRALTEAGVTHFPMVHPAARGRIRKKERYAAHVRGVLEEAGVL